MLYMPWKVNRTLKASSAVEAGARSHVGLGHRHTVHAANDTRKRGLVARTGDWSVHAWYTT